MPWGDVGAAVTAMLLFPGGVAALVIGVGAEALAARVSPTRAEVSRASWFRAWRTSQVIWPAALALVAAAQVSAPLNPIPGVNRSLLVAGVALVAAGWSAWAAGGWGVRAGRVLLAVQAAWVVAVFVPAALAETVRPQALGAVQVPVELPSRLAAGALCLLCLPVLLGLAGAAPTPLRPARALLWMPFCGLFVSEFLPPGGQDLSGNLWFLGAVLIVTVVTIFLAEAARRLRAGEDWRGARLLAALTVLTALIAGLTSILR